MNNKEISKNHQVIGSNVVKILKVDFILLLIDMIEAIFSYDNTGLNFAYSVLFAVKSHSTREISDC